MGPKKTANTKRDQWAVWKAVELAVELIQGKELDQLGPQLLVLEALGAGEWDDVVVFIDQAPGARQKTSWQLKRQNESLDGAVFSSLLADMKSQISSCGSDDAFCFATPHEVSLEFTGGATHSFRVLRDLCGTARAAGVNSDALVGKGTVKQRGWCKVIRTATGLTSNVDVAEFLARLHIHEVGTEEDLRNRAVKQLRTIYRNAEDLVGRIFSHIVQNSDGRIEITYEVLADRVLGPHGERDATRAPWLRVTRGRAWDPWHVAGPLGTAAVVASTWQFDAKPATIRVAATPQMAGDEVEAAFVRLVAHRGQTVNAEVDKPDDWLRYIRARTGGTFGFAADYRAIGLQPIPSDLQPPPSNTITPKELADRLQAEMDLHLWESLKRQVESALADPTQFGLVIHQSILAPMSALWRDWERNLDLDQPLRLHFLGMCLATNEEWSRSEFDQRMRLGAKALLPLVTGLLLGLAIGKALDDNGLRFTPSGKDGANFAIGQAPTHLLTLAYASMPGSAFGLKITDAAPFFLVDEAGCTIISEAEADPEALLLTAEGQAVPYNVSRASQADYQSAYSPKPILTNEVDLRRALRDGQQALQAFLAGRFKKFADAEWSFLRDAVERPITPEVPNGS